MFGTDGFKDPTYPSKGGRVLTGLRIHRALIILERLDTRELIGQEAQLLKDLLDGDQFRSVS